MHRHPRISQAFHVLHRLGLGDHDDRDAAADALADGFDVRKVKIGGVVRAALHFSQDRAAGHDDGDETVIGIGLA